VTEPKGRMYTNGHLHSLGYYGPPDPSLPLNRRELRQGYYANLPRAIRRQVFGRWRRKRQVYTHWAIEQARKDREAS
jgi:hypothetical protein